MINFEDLSEGTVLRFTNPTLNFYTHGDTYQVVDATDSNNIEVTDNDDSCVWDLEHLQQQFDLA